MSQHSDLLGDPLLGPDQQLRFRASRFNVRGEALDLRDLPCQQLACPRCHLIVPRALLEAEPIILSVIGAPASGKSHFLAAMAWEMRRVLADGFGVGFNDVDPDFNRCLNEYEETLFQPDDVERIVAIRKTELQGELYDQIHLGQQVVMLPRPFLFTMRPRGGTSSGSGRVRVLCMYDNAGEHFQPGMDTAATPGTQHLARSGLLMFLFDPTQHPRLRERCRAFSNDPQLHGAAPSSQRQETMLLEAVARIRRHTGLSAHEKHGRPLLVLVSKGDIWARSAGIKLESEPFVPRAPEAGPAGGPSGAAPGGAALAVDLGRVENVSALVRKFLATHAPNVITAAEDSFRQVIYLPVSALGVGPSVDARSGLLGVRPKDVHPQWVTVPLLYALARVRNGGIAAVRRAQEAPTATVSTAAAAPPGTERNVTSKLGGGRAR